MAVFELIGTRSFSSEDQVQFAAISGDSNPMHMDALAARRTQAGLPAVHGINAMLWALEQFTVSSAGPAIAGVTCKFERFVAVGTPVSLWLKPGDGSTRMEIRSDDVRLIAITVRHQPARRRGEDAAKAPLAAVLPEARRTQPKVCGFADLIHAHGLIEAAPVGDVYPLLGARIGADRVGAIVSMSYLVGMVAPGLHSIFSSVDLAFAPAQADTDDPAPAGTLRYDVVDAHDLFQLLDIAVAGGGVQGTIQAFLRPPPVQQPGAAALRAAVEPGAYAHVAALVIGGSRGLGEVAAKILAAGGARVAITYAIGKADAELVADDIRSIGGQCDVLQFDASKPMGEQVQNLPFMPNQVYYFATSSIAQQKSERFSADVFKAFQTIYVDGFAHLCAELSLACRDEIVIFYPSSVYIADRPRTMTEYAMAKAAAEVLCEDINRYLPRITTLPRRLPRLLTDQTATVTSTDAPAPTAVMLDVVAAMARTLAAAAATANS